MSEPNRTSEPIAELKRVNVREFVLDAAKEVVTHDRNNTYGEPEDVFSEIAEAWNAVFHTEFDGADVSLALILLKVVRAKHNSAHMDNWIDLAGYAACGAEVASKL